MDFAAAKASLVVIISRTAKRKFGARAGGCMFGAGFLSTGRGPVGAVRGLGLMDAGWGLGSRARGWGSGNTNALKS